MDKLKMIRDIAWTVTHLCISVILITWLGLFMWNIFFPMMFN